MQTEKFANEIVHVFAIADWHTAVTREVRHSGNVVFLTDKDGNKFKLTVEKVAESG